MAFVDFFNKPFPLTDSITIWMFCLLVLLVAGLTEVLKIPIKLATKQIKNDRIRHRVNLVIIALPVGLGMLSMYIISLIGYNITTKAIIFDGAYCGKSAVVLYEILSRVITVVKKKKGGEKVTIGDVFDAVTDGVISGQQAAQAAVQAAAEIADAVTDGNKEDKPFDVTSFVGDILQKYVKQPDDTETKDK